MRTITDQQIREAVATLCIQANRQLPPDVEEIFAQRLAEEPWALARETMELMQENVTLAGEKHLPVCQDTGMISVSVTLGQEVHISGNFQQAIHDGVAQGSAQGYLRNSMVGDPLRRVNTGNNTPASITLDLVPGDGFHMVVTPKGFGSENMSRMQMCRPSQGVAGVEAFVLETLKIAGPNACPPVIVGVGVGGNFDKVPYLAKKALQRKVTSPHPDPYYAALEKRLLEQINQLGIGPQGYGGKTTALAVAVEAAPTHVAGLPVAVCISCNVTRRASCDL